MFKTATAAAFAALLASAAAQSGSFSGSEGGEDLIVDGQEDTSVRVTTTFTTTSKAPSVADLATAMLNKLLAGSHPVGTTVDVVLKQSSTIPFSDDGSLCNHTGTTGDAVMTASEEGMGDTFSMRVSNAWKPGNTIDGACADGAPTGRRRRLSASHTVSMDVVSSTDVSAVVNSGGFEATLMSNLATSIAASPTAAAAVTYTYTIPTIDTSTIAYAQEVTYVITSTATVSATDTDTTAVTDAVTDALQSAGFSQAEIDAASSTITVAPACQPGVLDCSGGGGGTTDTGGAFTSTVSAGLVAVAASFLFM